MGKVVMMAMTPAGDRGRRLRMLATSRMSEKLRAGGAGADARAGQLTLPWRPCRHYPCCVAGGTL